MKKTFILLGIIVILTLAGFSSCGEDSDGPTVYVAGEYVHAGIFKACYWVNGNIHDLHAAVLNIVPTATSSDAFSIFVEGGDIYVAGWYNVGLNERACYWKNGSFVDISDGVSSRGMSIFAAGGKVYIAGWYSTGDRQACYWTVDNGITNRTHINITGTPSYSSTRSIFIANSKVYTAGIYQDGSSNFKPFYAENETAKNLSLGPGANFSVSSIFVSETDVYTAGNYDNHACYWKNMGTPIAVSGDNASSIIIVEEIPYISGSYFISPESFACYWTGITTKKMNTPTGTTSSWTSSIAVSGADVYTSGYYKKDGKNTGCYWVNGEFRTLKVPNGTEEYFAYSIKVE